MRLPVRTALLQNFLSETPDEKHVRLPVRTALLQNFLCKTPNKKQCDYQSERHCSKTLEIRDDRFNCAITSQNGTAPKPKSSRGEAHHRAITSQNGTAPKLRCGSTSASSCAITSQNGTAPKQKGRRGLRGMGAITSQNGTAPKRYTAWQSPRRRAITSQNGTAPKLRRRELGGHAVRLPVRTALLQNQQIVGRVLLGVRLPVRTALLQNYAWLRSRPKGCDYQSERHCSKTVGTNSLTAKRRPL